MDLGTECRRFCGAGGEDMTVEVDRKDDVIIISRLSGPFGLPHMQIRLSLEETKELINVLKNTIKK